MTATSRWRFLRWRIVVVVALAAAVLVLIWRAASTDDSARSVVEVKQVLPGLLTESCNLEQIPFSPDDASDEHSRLVDVAETNASQAVPRIYASSAAPTVLAAVRADLELMRKDPTSPGSDGCHFELDHWATVQAGPDRADVALVGTYSVALRPNATLSGPARRSPYPITVVLLRESGQWRIESMSKPPPPG